MLRYPNAFRRQRVPATNGRAMLGTVLFEGDVPVSRMPSTLRSVPCRLAGRAASTATPSVTIDAATMARPFVVDATDKDATLAAVRAVKEHGLAVIPRVLAPDPAAELSRTLHARVDNVMRDLAAVQDIESMAVGSANGYHEVVLRSPGRFDVPTSFDDFTEQQLAPFKAVVQGVLGDDAVPVFCGVVFSKPGSSAQEWHADSLHLYEVPTPAHLLNVLMILDDITMEMGPTEFAPGSQQLTNHRSNPRVKADEVVYQFATNSPEAIGMEGDDLTFQTPLPAGSVVVFDDRILHRGGANASDVNRYVAYFSYKRPWFIDETHFEATRSIYDPPQVGAAVGGDGESDLAVGVREQYTAIGRHSDAVFCDGASGSQVPECVVEAMVGQLHDGSANVGGYYDTSELALNAVAEARRATADLLNCDDAEVTFGHNMTTLTFHLAAAIAKLLRPGDNIVLTRLEHDANAAPWDRIAREAGAEVRWVPVVPGELSLDAGALAAAIDDNTRLLAVGMASNAVGTVNDVASACALAASHGAMTFVDAVAYTPHGLIDVRSLGCDFLTCSPYKFFGPHCGVLYGRAAVMMSLDAPKIRTAADELPSGDTWQCSRWELGTPNFEALAGLRACIDYIADIGVRFGDASIDDSRREQVEKAWDAVVLHENHIKQRFFDNALPLADTVGLQVLGITDTERLDSRTPTFAVVFRDADGKVHDPDDVTRRLVQRGVYCTSGNHYATFWEDAGDGLSDVDGATRLGFLHYNTLSEVDRVVEALHQTGKSLR